MSEDRKSDTAVYSRRCLLIEGGIETLQVMMSTLNISVIRYFFDLAVLLKLAFKVAQYTVL
jgi:hypothetical protein